MVFCYMLDYYIYKYNYIDVVKRKIFCEFEDKNFYINFDVYVGNIYNLIFNQNNGYVVDCRCMWYVDYVYWYLYMCMYMIYLFIYNMFFI